jgi:hypothetical protein
MHFASKTIACPPYRFLSCHSGIQSPAIQFHAHCDPHWLALHSEMLHEDSKPGLNRRRDGRGVSKVGSRLTREMIVVEDLSAKETSGVRIEYVDLVKNKSYDHNTTANNNRQQQQKNEEPSSLVRGQVRNEKSHLRPLIAVLYSVVGKILFPQRNSRTWFGLSLFLGVPQKFFYPEISYYTYTSSSSNGKDIVWRSMSPLV